MEVAISGPGQMLPYARMIRRDIAVVTSIGSEHNRSFKSLEATRTEKSEMVRFLPETGLAVLNGDDPHVLWMKNRTTTRIITFGFKDSNNIWAEDVSLDWPRGMRFMLRAGSFSRQMHTHMVGRHMIYPILAAVATAHGEGLPLDSILPSLEALRPTPGRMQPLMLDSGAYLLRDDYKSAMETIETALDSLSEIPARQKIVVLGDIVERPGSQGPLYKKIGEKLAKTASRVVIVADKRAFEGYRAGLYRGGFPRDCIVNARRSLVEAVEAVRKNLGPGDVVLIKGEDTRRLERVAFALMGRDVRCHVIHCHIKTTRCADCEMLEQGLGSSRVKRA